MGKSENNGILDQKLLYFQIYNINDFPILFQPKRGEQLLNDKELENMDKAIKAIGQANTCITAPIIKAAKSALLEKGYEGAEAYAAQLTGTDENTELLRVLAICKSYRLGPEAAAKVIENLNRIESGKW